MTLRALTLGVSESGKNEYNRREFLATAGHILTVDPNGELAGQPGIIAAEGYRGTLQALARVAGAPSWHVAAYIPDYSDIVMLSEALLYKKSLAAPSLAQQLGGLVLSSGECAELCPLAAPSPVTALWRRGRHFGISPVVATQRPADCNIIVRGQSQIITIFRLTDDRSLEWVARNVGGAVADYVAALPLYHSVRWRTNAAECERLDGNYRVIGRVPISRRWGQGVDNSGTVPNSGQ
jgi:hypothetical protein